MKETQSKNPLIMIFFWDVTTCSVVVSHQIFGQIYRLLIYTEKEKVISSATTVTAYHIS